MKQHPILFIAILSLILFIESSFSTVSMNRHGDLLLHSLKGGNIVFSTGDGDVVVDRKGKSTNLLSSLAVLEQVAGQLCWLIAPADRIEWEQLDETLQLQVADSSAQSIGTEIYLFGGQSTSYMENVTDLIQIFHTVNKTWSSAHMKIKRKQHVTAVDPQMENIFIFGGVNQLNQKLNSYEIFNVATRNSTLYDYDGVHNLDKHVGGTASVVQNKIYFFGGRGDGNTIIGDVSVFDLEENKFLVSPTQKVTPLRWGMASTTWLDKIFLYGGRDLINITSYVQVFDTKTETFNMISPFGSGNENAQAVSLQGLGFLIGGRGDAGNGAIRVHQDCDTMNFRNLVFSNKITGLMHLPREGFSAVTVDNYIYVLGGRVATGSNVLPTDSVERIIPCY